MSPSGCSLSVVARQFLHRKGLAATSACLFFLLLSFDGNVSAYVNEKDPRSHTILSWPAGSVVTFQVALGNAGRTLIDGNTSWDTAVAPVPGLWDQNMQRLRFLSVTNPSTPVGKFDGVNSISFASTFFGSSFGSNTLAITSFSWSTSDYRISEADVLFNKHQNWDSYRGGLHFGSNGIAIGEIRRVLLHELGHALGLDHPDDFGQHVIAVMNSRISAVELPSADDVAGAQSLYGAPTSFPTPTPTPAPTPTPTPTATPTPTSTSTPVTLPLISLSAAPTSVRVGGSATFTLTTSLVNASAPIVINYLMGGSAIQGKLYSLSGTGGQITIPAGSSSATVNLAPLKRPKKAKTATMTLASGSGYTLSVLKSASVKITK